ncbi:hypothetical protein DIURU_001727 [Diutina rugosa]|uniref:Zn(2)-C6 fungal-type domain-containing protein n=1 Tax=Diutina rugosa TaxID=5481 RepID=A0A642UYM9_DIURU|nr:uncharacterized protein DIURU_001727 [Diutina rugosa]KAA8905299.1 hypothetical protein DIURU_001727 [Diutina rugosa]
MELPYKKRNRVPASCSVCRKRKSKCDRVKPICGSCKKKSISHLCYYEADSKEPSGHVTYVQPLTELSPASAPPNGPQGPPLPMPMPQPSRLSSFPPFDPQGVPIHHHSPEMSMISPGAPSNGPQLPLAPPTVQSSPPGTFGVPPPSDSFVMSPGASSITSGMSIPPPAKNASHRNSVTSSYVNIPLGPSTTLSVSSEDEITTFQNASFSLNTEGPWWSQQGMLSYIGLTKSDPFLKVLRNYALHLFKSGEMAKFIKPASKGKRSSASASPTTVKKSRIDTDVASDKSTSQKLRCDSLDPVQEDSLVIQRIAKEETEPETDDVDDDQIKLDDDGPSTIAPPPIDPLSQTKAQSPQHPRADAKLPSLDTISSIATRVEVYQLIMQHVIQVLPDKLNLFMLYCRYFKYVHAFIPILDEKQLLSDVEGLFNSFPNFSREKYSSISIESDHDLITLGLFLVVIRLGYMSLLHNDSLEYNEDEKSMIRSMRRINHSAYLKLLFACFQDHLVGSSSSLKLVQGLSLLHFYRSVIPSDCLGLGAADGNNLFGTIVRHAMSIGLNRDPTFYLAHDTISKRHSLIKSWRALWHYLVITDSINSVGCGTYPSIPDLSMSDVEPPIFKDATGKVNEVAFMVRKISNHYRKIVLMINDVTHKPKVVDVLQETNALEKLFFQMFGKDFFKDVICKPASSAAAAQEVGTAEHEEAFLKVVKYSIFVHLRTNLSCMYYMIALHYENQSGNESSVETGLGLFKIYVKSVVQLVYIMSFVLDNSVRVFGRNYDYFLTANNERCMVKTHAFLTSFFVRLLHHRMDLSLKIPNEPKFAQRLEVVDRFFNVVIMESELFIGSFRVLSKNYLSSWKVFIMSSVVLKQCVDNPTAFFKGIQDPRFFHQGSNTLDLFTNQEIEKLCNLCEEFRVAKEEYAKSRGIAGKGSVANRRKNTQGPFSPQGIGSGRNSETTSTTSFSPSMAQPHGDEVNVDISQVSSVLDGFTPMINEPSSSVGGNGLLNFSNLGGSVFDDNPNVDLMKLFEMYTGNERHDV